VAVLPFLTTGEIRDKQSEDPLAEDVPMSIWRVTANRRTLPSGQSYEWRAEVQADAAEHLVGKGNRRIIANGQTFTVVEAIAHVMLPHVEVFMRESKAHG
jgi:hypothetical protein